MEFINFPTVALGTALICLIGLGIYALTQRTSLRSRDEQLVVARAQAYAMLELSQAGVLFLDREHKLMGEASAAAPELLGHTCGAGTAFVQVIAGLVDVTLRREAVAYLESLWKAAPSEVVDATQNPLQRIHSGSHHLALRFSRLVVDGRVHHIIVSIERISAPRLVPHTIEVPALNEETFAKRLAGETGARPALTDADLAALAARDAAAAETPREPAASAPQPTAPPAPEAVAPAPAPAEPAVDPIADALAAAAGAPAKPVDFAASATLPSSDALGPLDITEDSLPSLQLNSGEPVSFAQSLPPLFRAAPPAPATLPEAASDAHLATTVNSSNVLGGAPDPMSIIDPPDARLTAALEEILHIDAARLEHFLVEAREKAGQVRAIIKLPAREPQAFREKLVLILELIRGINSRAERLPLPSVSERAERFEAALGALRDKQTLSGNDFLPLAVKLDDLLSHLAIQGEVVARLAQWRAANGVAEPPLDATLRSATATGTTIRQPRLRKAAPSSGTANTSATTIQQPPLGQKDGPTQKAARLSDLSQESLTEMAQFLADMYAKRVSLVVVGLEDVPTHYRKPIEKILGQLIHNAIRHGVEAPADRAAHDKPEVGTVAVQFARAGADGFQLSVQDDGRGLDHEKIRAEAVRQGVLTAEAAASTDPRKLASLIFRPGFTTVADGARGIGMDVVRELVNKAGGKVGIATKPGEYTRFRITLPHEKKDSNAAVA